MPSRRQHKSTFITVSQLPSGRFRVRYTDPDGERRALPGTFATKSAAEDALAALRTDLGRGDWIDPDLGAQPFRVLAERYVKHRASGLAPGTQNNNRLLLSKHLLPTFGHVPVSKITVSMVDAWWDSWTEHYVNRRNAYFLLRKVLRYGVRWGYTKTNPAMVENAGANVAQRRPQHSVEEFEAVVSHLDPVLRRAAWVAFGAHLRISELAGLNIADYSTKTGMLTVEWQANAEGERVPTKTRNRKVVTVLSAGQETLSEQLAERQAIGAAPIFVGPAGGRLRVPYVRKHWKKACVAGVETMTLHDIRHVSLTFVAPGIPIEELKRRGGHKTAAAALIYQSASDERDVVVAQAADERLRLRRTKSANDTN